MGSGLGGGAGVTWLALFICLFQVTGGFPSIIVQLYLLSKGLVYSQPVAHGVMDFFIFLSAVSED